MGNVILEYAEGIGEKRGIKIGEKRGEMRSMEKSAIKMAAKGYQPDEIIDITGVSLERLKELLKK